MLRAVTLDYWNTLFVDYNGAERERRRAARLREELAAVGVAPPDDAVEEALSRGHAFFERIWVKQARTPATAEILAVILETLGVRLPEQALRRLIHDFGRMLLEVPPQPVEDVPAVVRELTDTYRLAVVCDTGYSPGNVLRELLARHDMLDCFDYLYFSNEGGMSKPDPRVFRRVLQEFGVSPTHAAHVGDMQRTDIRGAQGVGMRTVHFLGASAADEEVSTADIVVRHFRELPAVLARLAR